MDLCRIAQYFEAVIGGRRGLERVCDLDEAALWLREESIKERHQHQGAKEELRYRRDWLGVTASHDSLISVCLCSLFTRRCHPQPSVGRWAPKGAVIDRHELTLLSPLDNAVGDRARKVRSDREGFIPQSRPIGPPDH